MIMIINDSNISSTSININYLIPWNW